MENFSPAVVAALGRQIRALATSPPDGIIFVPSESLHEIFADITGPAGTPYEGGTFRVKLVLGLEYPAGPPKGYFLTKIFHPNVSDKGDICVNTLKKDWKPDTTLAFVLAVVRCLLIVPFPESSLNDDAGKLFMESYDEYCRKARLVTSIHAMRASAAAAAAGAGASDAAAAAGSGSASAAVSSGAGGVAASADSESGGGAALGATAEAAGGASAEAAAASAAGAGGGAAAAEAAGASATSATASSGSGTAPAAASTAGKLTDAAKLGKANVPPPAGGPAEKRPREAAAAAAAASAAPSLAPALGAAAGMGGKKKSMKRL